MLSHGSAFNPVQFTISARVYGTTRSLGSGDWPWIIDKFNWTGKTGYSPNLHRTDDHFRFGF